MLEEAIYLGEIPIMTGGGEFIINGAERVIVSQLHRSPGVDFVIDSQEGDRPLHATRVIPERGSWIEINVTKKDVLAVRIDQSAKIPATTFLRAMDEKYSTNEALLRSFYECRMVPVGQLKPEFYAVGRDCRHGDGRGARQVGLPDRRCGGEDSGVVDQEGRGHRAGERPDHSQHDSGRRMRRDHRTRC